MKSEAFCIRAFCHGGCGCASGSTHAWRRRAPGWSAETCGRGR
jgi:hypothetical protein